MSLNGLDEAPVIEAYQFALAEAGGWFLLKYITRDSVDLLGRGNGGVVEVRNAIAQYEEKSALYGFVQYRRRKVVLKYVPEGTSRLLLARVTVQFQSVLDKFYPHDTVFSLAAPTDLTETALSAACRLHTASGSITSSSSSLRRRRLGEITEDAEEGGNDRERLTPDREAPSEWRPRQRRSDLREQVDVDAVQDLPSPSAETSAPALLKLREPPPVEPPGQTYNATTNKLLPSTPCDPSEEHSPTVVPERHFLEELSRPSYDRRQSSQSTRPSAWELDRTSQYGAYKSKVKLGPRPSLEHSSRPKTSGSQYRQSEPRPVSTLPSSIRTARQSASHRPKSPKSPGSAVSEPSHSTPKEKPEDLPPLPSPPPNLHISAFYNPPTIKIATAPRLLQAAPKSPGITPEKQRLMRALQLRKKQMAQMAQAKTQGENESNESHESHEDPPQMEDKAGREVSESLDILPEISKTESLTDIVHVNLGSEQDTEHGRPITSPVSLPEVSEGPSTQGSSFTEESEQHTQELDDTPTQEDLRSTIDTSLTDSEIQAEPESIHPMHSDVIRNQKRRSKECDSVSLRIPSSPKGNLVSSDQESSADTFVNLEPQSGTELDREQQALEAVPKAISVSPRLELPDQMEKPYASQETSMPDVDFPIQSPETETTAEVKPETASFFDERVQPAFQALDEHDDLIDTRPSTANTSDKRSRERKNRRRAMVDPIRVVSSAENSDDDLPSDDDFMEELKSARLEEAKPVSVARSPITPVFGNGKTNGESRQTDMARDQRAVSVPSDSSPQNRNLTPDLPRSSGGRSFSAALPAWPPNSDPAAPLVAKKTNVSSGISKRIKALEMFTSREASSSPPSSQGSVNTPASSPFASFRKLKSLSHNAPNVTTQTSPPKQVPYPSPSPTPEPQFQTPTWSQRTTPSSKKTTPKQRDSISVTARIIRDPSAPKMDEVANPSEPTPLNLQRSPLIVEHEKAEPVPRPATAAESSKSPKPERRRPSISSVRSRRNSSSANLPHSDSKGSRMSISGRTMHSEGNLPRSMSNFSDNSSVEGEKKESRKSRLMKRMSSITSNSRRSLINAISPTVKEEPPAPLAESTEPSIAETPPQVVDIGDVNVQFPDTLLWKRRFMRIDDEGYLILTPPNMDTNARNISKRYHLSEFRKPCLPDLERQELPNSILLDLSDGTTLQCACESKYTQQQVLQALVDAHRAYHQLYSG